MFGISTTECNNIRNVFIVDGKWQFDRIKASFPCCHGAEDNGRDQNASPRQGNTGNSTDGGAIREIFNA
jgi:hypothetical protein